MSQFGQFGQCLRTKDQRPNTDMNHSELKNLLETLYHKYNRIDFIEHDPILIPHLYSKKQDIEIAAFIAAIFAWGQRVTIINKSKEFLSYMDNDPHQFILNHTENDLKPFLGFKHRTFNDTDALYFISFLKIHYEKYNSLEDAFILGSKKNYWDAEQGLIGFKDYFFSLEDYPTRTIKHISSPKNNSTCKRLNMFLRWMVRKDEQGVDFGIWSKIKPSSLVCPIDVHVANTARQFGLISEEVINWKTAIKLTEQLKSFDSEDPVKYDFALFGLGVSQGI